MGQLDIWGGATPEPTLEQEYQLYVKSPKWRLKRSQALARANHKCERCGLSKWSGRLEVHHKTYERLGCENLSDLEVLCVDCHSKADRERERDVEVRRERRQAAALYSARLDGWAAKVYGEDWWCRGDVDRIEDEFESWRDRRDNYY